MDDPDYRASTDDAFLQQCRIDTFRGPGPGGQKRNKTSSAVRITHTPTDLHAIAGELRSQSQNRAMALRRLRLRLAIELRQPVDLATPPPAWFMAVIGDSGKLNVSERNDLYPRIAGLVLDALSAADYATAPAKDWLRVGSSQLTKFLHSDPAIWAVVQRERAARGLRALEA